MASDKDMDKLKALSAKTYKEQAIWFLNAYWNDNGEAEKENVWGYANAMIELDPKGKAGNELEELLAHRFLEKKDETKTVRELREQLRKIDIDTNKHVSLSEYLIFRYDLNWHRLVNASQGDNAEEVAEAQRLLAEAQQKLGIARQQQADARKAENDQRATEAAAKRALEELQAEEKAFENRRIGLERATQTGGIVSRNKAKNELEQLLGEDPLPLRRAKINQEAAVRANQRATLAAEEARRAADASLAAATAALEEAEAYLEEVKMRGGSGEGVLWWIDRELHEARKYLPQAKGGIIGKK